MGFFEEIVPRIQIASIQFFPFLVAVVFHEFSHGWIASLFGDTTAKDQGRLTLNPMAHLDWIGTVLFPLINMLSGISLLIGWAKPVPIDPSRFKSYRPGLFFVSLAGPLMNVVLAGLSAGLLCALIAFSSKNFYFYEPFIAMAYVSVSLNFALAVFNLLPLPPLDGSKIIQSFLSIQKAMQYESFSRYSFFILIALLLSGALNILAAPIEWATRYTLALMALAFDLSPSQVGMALDSLMSSG